MEVQGSPFLLTFLITNLLGIAQEWGKINLEKCHTHKSATVPSGHPSMLQLLQKETPLCVCLFANE